MPSAPNPPNTAKLRALLQKGDALLKELDKIQLKQGPSSSPCSRQRQEVARTRQMLGLAQRALTRAVGDIDWTMIQNAARMLRAAVREWQRARSELEECVEEHEPSKAPPSADKVAVRLRDLASEWESEVKSLPKGR